METNLLALFFAIAPIIGCWYWFKRAMHYEQALGNLAETFAEVGRERPDLPELDSIARAIKCSN